MCPRKVIGIPDAMNVIGDCPIAVVKGSSQKSLARKCTAFELSDRGQSILTENGFIPVKPAAEGKSGPQSSRWWLLTVGTGRCR